MNSVLLDVRYAFRALRKTPGFTAVAVLTLALGIGANTAIFSVVNAVLLRSLPLKEPERLVAMSEANKERGWNFRAFSFSPPNYLDVRAQVSSLSDAAAFNENRYALTGEAEAEWVDATLVTQAFFGVLGVVPELGRVFSSEEMVPGAEPVAILSHGLWTRRFGGSGAAVGRPIRLDGVNYRIVGVMPREFRYPLDGADLWTPMILPNDVATQRGAHYINAIGRLKPGVTLAQLRQELATLAGQLEVAYPRTNTGWIMGATSLGDSIFGEVRPGLLIMLGAVGLVALIACANVANLLLARVSRRDTELAVRTALGAGRARLIRPSLIESMMLAPLGGALALLLALWGVEAIVKLAPPEIPRLSDVGLDTRVLGFTMLLSLITGAGLGLAPLWRTGSSDLNHALKAGARGSASGDRGRLRGLLVMGEMALAVMLLAGAGLLIKSFVRLEGVSPGLDPRNVVTFELGIAESKYVDGKSQSEFFQRLVERVNQIPGVTSAGAIFGLPLTGWGFSSSFTVEGEPPLPPGSEPSSQVRMATRDYFPTMGISVQQGRGFEAGDHREAPRVVLASAAAAHKFWPRGDAIGHRLRFGARSGPDRMSGEIVGIVSDVRDGGLNREPTPLFYVPIEQSGTSIASVVVKTAGPADLGRSLTAAVHELDPEVPVSGFATMETVLSRSIARSRFYVQLLAIFAAVALSLAAVGIYGVMSYTVGGRTREIGIRMALGAGERKVLAMVVRQAMSLVLVGLVAGVIGALATTRVLAGLLFGVHPTDPTTFVGVSAVLIGVALVASYLPARRATRIDPMLALKE